MRKNTILFSLTSILLTLCIPARAQSNMMDSLLLRLQEFSEQTGVKVERIEKASSGADVLEIQKKIPGWEEPKVIGTKEVYPKDLGIVTNDSYRAKMLEYAPEGYVCGYIMRNSWNKNLWGIFLVKEGRKYSIVYKEADKTETRSIKADQAKELEASVNKKIADTEHAATTPVTVNVYEGIDEAVMVYEGNYAFAVTSDKAVYSWASNMGKYKGINDEIWQKKIDSFK